MNNLKKSVLILNKVLDILLGNRFTTPIERTLKYYPGMRFTN